MAGGDICNNRGERNDMIRHHRISSGVPCWRLGSKVYSNNGKIEMCGRSNLCNESK